MKRIFLIVGLLSIQGIAIAQTEQAQSSPFDYNYAELRFVDTDRGSGDGLRVNGSFELQNNWLVVGGLTLLDFNSNVDSTTFEIGGGYVHNYSPNWDLVGTARFVRVDVDTPFGGGDDNGFALSAGARGWLTPEFEVRGSVNHLNLDNSDTYLELAGDYYFSESFSAGLSLDFAGDDDVFTLGARWFFR
ncbi:MAG: hypothetical protein ACR2QQ_14285 [Gammaproteobacteria bacterium]